MPLLDITTITDDQITQLREKFFKFEGEEDLDAESNVPTKYDLRDVEQFRSDDTTVRFFLSHGKLDIEEALKVVKGCFAWRKQFGVREIDFDAFPDHVKSSNGVSIHGTDKEGRRIIWMYMNRLKRTKNDVEIWSRYFVYHLEKLYQQRGDKRLIFVNDMTGIGITNFDYELTRFAVNLFENHYPDLLAFQVTIGSRVNQV
ncbi:motile sperm domain-containing protein 2-like isoform X2 [Symsagittifera roscoffensis]|uniref:motile sperm domain-containing protein 2-like isoform X2 n=1 Tax=Symsagittifera roscoffensis TaxID=84072 RepID=UPI00307BCEBD